MKSFFTLLFTSLILTSQVFAHPGRTASDGCHYCRTNCDKWGVPWNVRHCHNGHKEHIDIGELLKTNFVEKEVKDKDKDSKERK